MNVTIFLRATHYRSACLQTQGSQYIRLLAILMRWLAMQEVMKKVTPKKTGVGLMADSNLPWLVTAPWKVEQQCAVQPSLRQPDQAVGSVGLTPFTRWRKSEIVW